MKKLLTALLMLLAPIAPAQTPPAMYWFWCIDLNLGQALWDKPVFQMANSGMYVFARQSAMRMGIGPFATQADCTTYMNSETASNYTSPDALNFTYSYVDMNGNPGTYSPSYAQMNPVPDTACTQHYL